MKEKQYDVVIVGCGVAGMTAALYLKRSNVNCLVVEGEMPGGQIVKTNVIHNYPGFKSITGVELAQKMLAQLKELKVEIVYKKVVDLRLDQDVKMVCFEDKSSVVCEKVILATGRIPRKLHLANEEKLLGRGISYCATCDGALYQGKTVAVVGGGDSALEEAVYLSSLCKKVYLIHRRDHFRAKNYLQEELGYVTNIEIVPNAHVLELLEEDEKLCGLRLLKDGIEEKLEVDGCFVFIGYEPATSAFAGLSIVDDDGYILTNENMETNIPGIYAVGDVRKKDICQIVTAASDGAIAAIHILKK